MRRHLHFFKFSVENFLARYTKWGPWHCGKPPRVDVFITLLADPEAAFLNTTEGCASVSKLARFAVKVTNRECSL